MVLREENFSRVRLPATVQQERRRCHQRKETRRAVCECDFVHICAGVCP